jgi:hypothetical protein
LDHLGHDFGLEVAEGDHGVGDDLRQEGEELAMPISTWSRCYQGDSPCRSGGKDSF